MSKTKLLFFDGAKDVEQGKDYEVLCIVDSSKNLTKGHTYIGRLDKNLDFRIKANDGKWNKYSTSNFQIVGETTNQDAQDAKDKQEEEPVKSNVKTIKKKVTLKDLLLEQGVKEHLLKEMAYYRRDHALDEDDPLFERVPKLNAHQIFRGGKVLNQAIERILSGGNILLEGEKATGKNLLCMNLAFFFGRPIWDISCHNHIDAISLIGADTLKAGEVVFKPGAVYNVAKHGGFGVLDEINMAKNEAVAVLHSILDDRRVIDVPGYERIKLHECTRFIGTMNYGYVGTKELNEALVSRFTVIHVAPLSKSELVDLLYASYGEHYDKDTLTLFAQIFDDLRTKAKNGEISTRSVDMRGIKCAIEMCINGIKPFDALESNIINKAFEEYEREIIRDTIVTTIPVSCDDVKNLIALS